MAKRILIGLDGSPLAETIVAPVCLLARRLGAEVLLVHVIRVPDPLRDGDSPLAIDEIVAHQRAGATRYLAAVADRVRADVPDVRSVIATGEAPAEIVRCAAREQVDLIALATHGRSGVQRWIHGNVADGVLRTTSTPLLLLRPSTDAPAAEEVHRLVVALDGSPLGEAALAVAEDLAKALAVPIGLVRVVESDQLAFSVDPFGSPYLDYERIVGLLRGDAEQYLARLAGDARKKGLTVETSVSVGSPADVIAAQGASSPGTLLVLGTHGRTGWRAALLGSVARRVVLVAGSPILVVPPPGRASMESRA